MLYVVVAEGDVRRDGFLWVAVNGRWRGGCNGLIASVTGKPQIGSNGQLANEPDLIDRIANALPEHLRADCCREMAHCRALLKATRCSGSSGPCSFLPS